MAGGTFGYSIATITGVGSGGEDWIVVRAGVTIGTAVGLGGGVGNVVGVVITGLQLIALHVSTHSHLIDEVAVIAASGDGAGESSEGGLIVAFDVAVTI